MREGKIQVVSHEGELLFRAEDVLLDMLDAHDFCYAKIVIIHDGKETDFGSVYEIGTHGSTPIFSGLLKMREGLAINMKNLYCHSLLPTYFKEGDEISFEIDAGFQWEVDFKKSYAGQQVVKKLDGKSDQICTIKDDAEFDREWKKYQALVVSEVDAFVYPSVIIFRRYNPIVIKSNPRSN